MRGCRQNHLDALYQSIQIIHIVEKGILFTEFMDGMAKHGTILTEILLNGHDLKK